MCVVSVQRFDFYRCNTILICVWAIQTSKVYKSKTKNQINVINILQNRSHRYSSHKNNIKYVDSVIKYIGFESIRYITNLDVVSSFMIFNNFDYIFLSIYSCGCRRILGAAGVCIVSVQRFDFHRRSATFICVQAIKTSKVYKSKIKNQINGCQYATKSKS